MLEKENLPNPSSTQNLVAVLADPRTLQLFQDHLTKEFCGENLQFWLEVEKFKKQAIVVKKQKSEACWLALLKKGRYIFSTYVEDFSPLQVNLTSDVVRQIKTSISNIGAFYNDAQFLEFQKIFDDAQEHAFDLMLLGSFSRFKFTK